MTIFGSAVAPPADTESAAWIASLLGDFGTVGGLVPDGFEQYLLVRHKRIQNRHGNDVGLISTIASLAERHTTTPDRIWFAIWEGYGWAGGRTGYPVSGGGLSARLVRVWLRHRTRLVDLRRARRIHHGLANVPLFDLPNRRYYLVCGPLHAAPRIVEPGGSGLQVPDLWWPGDRQWFVATDTDLEWTYLGGSHAFIADVTAALPDLSEPVQRNHRNVSF